MHLDVLRLVKQEVSIPVAMKLSPSFSSIPHMAGRLAAVRADGLVLFNRFYQPDFDIERLEVVPSLHLSQSQELQLPFTWVSILYGRVNVDLAISTAFTRTWMCSRA